MSKDESKPWGRCQPIALTHCCQLDCLTIKAGGYSSLHFHRIKHNHFIIESGSLEIYWLRGHKCFTRYFLLAGDSLTIPPGILNVHQFHAFDDTVMHEFYWQAPRKTPLDREEIVRLTVNGIGDFQPPTYYGILGLVSEYETRGHDCHR